MVECGLGMYLDMVSFLPAYRALRGGKRIFFSDSAHEENTPLQFDALSSLHLSEFLSFNGSMVLAPDAAAMSRLLEENGNRYHHFLPQSPYNSSYTPIAMRRKLDNNPPSAETEKATVNKLACFTALACRTSQSMPNGAN